MQIIFAHHGESTANVRRIISNRGLKHELTDLGRQQAHELATRIQSPVRKVYTSPIQRAVETTQIVTEAWGVEYEVVDALREYDCGVLEGRGDDEAWQEHVEVRRQWYKEHNLDRRAEGGESFLDIQARFVPFVDALLERYRDIPETIVCVGHTGTYCAALPLVLTNVDHTFARDHLKAGTYAIIAEPRADELLCLSWCDMPMV